MRRTRSLMFMISVCRSLKKRRLRQRIVTATRPDLAVAASQLASGLSAPTDVHWRAGIHVLRYLAGTQDLVLHYRRTGGRLYAYSDASWANDSQSSKSRSGYVFMLAGAAVSWRSQKQSLVATSSTEAEYYGIAECMKEAIYLRQLMEQLGLDVSEPTVVYEDNKPAIHIATNSMTTGRSKHFRIRMHFIRDELQKRTAQLKYCNTSAMAADIMTKILSRELTERFRSILFGIDSDSSQIGE